MEEKKEHSLGFWVAMLAFLVVGVLAIFTFLGMMARSIDAAPGEVIQSNPVEIETPADAQGETPEADDGESAAPAFCPFCGEKMTDSFRWGQFCPFCGEKVEQ